jgi:hypothetical protein
MAKSAAGSHLARGLVRDASVRTTGRFRDAGRRAAWGAGPAYAQASVVDQGCTPATIIEGRGVHAGHDYASRASSGDDGAD